MSLSRLFPARNSIWTMPEKSPWLVSAAATGGERPAIQRRQRRAMSQLVTHK
jgi:hypothetical protein